MTLGESDKKQHTTFLTCTGQETFNLAQVLLSLAGLGNIPFSLIKEKLKQHFAPKRPVIVCHRSFYKQDQMATKMIAQYVMALCFAACVPSKT